MFRSEWSKFNRVDSRGAKINRVVFTITRVRIMCTKLISIIRWAKFTGVGINWATHLGWYREEKSQKGGKKAVQLSLGE